ncbi:MAG TPA: rod shape-determining protein MreC [Thermomicrobiales bacterium]|nr:rod shape-determining protein MreC [Thermomicrobiales bacterium]
MTLTLRQTATLLTALIVVSISLIVLDGRNQLDGAKGALGEIVAPVGESLSGFGARFAPSNSATESELAAENERLRDERDALLAENARLRELEPKVQQLEDQLLFQEAQPNLISLPANVVGRDPQSREKFIVIDKGAADGVAIGMPVVSPHFLVGQVIEVDEDRSKVLLTVDSAFQTGALLQDSRSRGVIYGRWQAGGRMVMRHIPTDTEMSEGELVITSGMTSGIPEGLIIGQVIDMERDDLRNEVQADVIPAVNFDALQTVTVITGQQPE